MFNDKNKKKCADYRAGIKRKRGEDEEFNESAKARERIRKKQYRARKRLEKQQDKLDTPHDPQDEETES